MNDNIAHVSLFTSNRTTMTDPKETTPVVHAEVYATAMSNATTTVNSGTLLYMSNSHVLIILV